MTRRGHRSDAGESPSLSNTPSLHEERSGAGLAVRVEELTKDFIAVRALEDVTVEFRPGEVHAVIGENGAGKSTLMNILAGIVAPTRGRVRIGVAEFSRADPAEAARLGVAMVHQELNLVDELSVADNVALGREPVHRGLIRQRAVKTEARRLLELLGAEIDPARRVRDLGIAERQLVEIAKALATRARVLLLDEPTAVLGRDEVERLFGVIRRLRAENRTIIYISHLLPEVLEISDRITILRDGKLVQTLAPPQTKLASEEQLASLMVGRPLAEHFPTRSKPGRDIVLEVEVLEVPPRVAGVSLRVRRGEILGVAGLVGAGRTELGEAIAGIRRRASGTVTVLGRALEAQTPREAVDAGIAYLSEDRRGAGLVMELDVVENITLASLSSFGRIFVDRRAEARVAARHVDALGIKIGRLRDPVAALSGGNQQKVALARWLETAPKALILDEPTRGIDIGAKEEIYRTIVELARQGLACLLISSELNELLGLCHRIAVMRNGKFVEVVDGPAATEALLMNAAAGVRRVEA